MAELLLAVRLVGFGPVDRVAARVAIPEHQVAPLLRHLEQSGWVTYREGPWSGWSLTAAGRAHGERLLATEVDSLGVRPRVRSLYERFLDLNPVVLDLCTRWQVRMAGPIGAGTDGSAATMSPNTHDDAAYDEQVIADLVTLHVDVRELLGELASLTERFGRYRSLLDAALDRVRAGEHDWFAKPVVESYHTVWFELHEQFLAALGLERG
ncbi:MAG: hypothetical protein R2698_12895 [Microthrixaceae bacterium]